MMASHFSEVLDYKETANNIRLHVGSGNYQFSLSGAPGCNG
jgi:hypothetical protein